jgi:hypothetical protein
MSKKNYEPLEVRHRDILQGYFLVDQSNGGYHMVMIESEEDGIEPELFSTKELAQQRADQENKPSNEQH